MTGRTNHLGQPIGYPVDGWTPAKLPPRTAMAGRYCRTEPLDPERHARNLHAANSEDRDGRMWTYLPWGPYASFADYLAAAQAATVHDTRITYAVVDAASGKAVGVASYLNINPAAGSIEVGAIAYASAAEETRRHRGDVPDDAARVRRARLPPLRMEVQFAERAVARRGRALRLPL
jgi:hypothetical protein